MRTLLLVVVVLSLMGASAWAKCPPEETGKWLVQPKGGGGFIIDITLNFSSTTTALPFFTTAGFAQASETSDCGGKNATTTYRIPPEQFVADTSAQLAVDAARGEGHYLRAVAALIGCRAPAFPAFAQHVQGRYSELYPDEALRPAEWVGLVRQGIAVDTELAAGCPVEA